SEITGYAYRLKENGEAFGIEDLAAWLDIPDGASVRSYTVTGLTNGTEYKFELRAENEHGGGIPAKAIARLPASAGSRPVSTEDEEMPDEVALMGNYPNPFNPETAISYALPQAGEVRLAVYDLLGHELAVLVDGLQPAGRHTVRFDANDLPNGPYAYRLQAGTKVLTRTMMLVK
ncbi:MAG: T9SS type A sorting domain-containing protein, partial [Bacteroidetes bacterium SB0662_bin_6]|nr:T9SS type A sorting domain-containing protein [Bacteroidetes bacterium SB0668_bin_1]MYE05527.1 T9SS type A sorting domain-containing protein [Bacteroidetes bacterium SB0662_bin_6]